MVPFRVVCIFPLGLVLAVWGCTPRTADQGQPSTESAANETGAPAGADPAALESGRYCYGIDADGLEGVVRLSVADSQSVTGDSVVTVQNPAEGYFTSYAQKLSGILQDNQATVDITTWIEYGVEESQEVWTVTPETLQTERSTFTAIDCEQARERFVGPDGLEAADLLEGATAVNTERVQFEPGSSSDTVEGAVVRGDRNVYEVNAEGGQTLILQLTSLEDNAVLDVISPSGFVLARESTAENLLLPHTGDYQIIVGGTRGNASYSLQIEITQ